MKTTLLRLLALFALLPAALAQGTAFTYQGRLGNGTNGANGIFDLKFAIPDSSPRPRPGALTNALSTVSNGLCTASLDGGSAAPLRIWPSLDGRWFVVSANGVGLGVASSSVHSVSPLKPSRRRFPPGAVRPAMLYLPEDLLLSDLAVPEDFGGRVGLGLARRGEAAVPPVNHRTCPLPEVRRQNR